ncbi:uncharacterized protein LOC117254724 [Epinephelus lanceolatus]
MQAALNISLRLALFNMAKNVTEERDELRRINSDIEASCKNLTEERDDLKRKLNHSVSQQNSLTEERDKLRRINSDIEASRKNLTEERDDLKRKLNDCVSQQNSLTEERDKLNRAIQGCRMELEKLSPARWMYFRGSFYHISSDQKTWQESRRDCQQKDADLVIINSKEEQDFTRQFKKYMWIGLTDLQTEGTWKWVDGTQVTKSYWGPKEPNGGSGENCGEMKFDSENSWNDGSCSLSHFWMCEKKVHMEMIVLEEESEISVVNENLHDASAENAASKIHFVEDNDMPAAVPGLEEVGNSCCRDTAVFLVCFVSLTGLILSVSSVNLFVYTSKTVTRHNSEWESKTDQLQTSYNNNLIKERDQLQTSYDNLIKERDWLQTSCSNLTKERDQLQTSCTNLTKKNNQLQTSYNKLAKKNGDLQRKLEGIEASCKNLTEEREELKKNLHDFASEGWMYFRGSFYNISSTEKTWADSRDDCRRKGADLVIINSKEEQEFTRQFQKYMWIGLTDSETEGVWKWVDGTPVTKSYWGSGEPNNKEDEDCAEIKYHDKESSWNDGKCSLLHLWICEKKVLP